MSKNHSVGLPKIPPDFGDDVTRPMSLHEFSEQVQVDHDLAIINKRHERVAKASRENNLTNYSDCGLNAGCILHPQFARSNHGTVLLHR